MTMTMIVRQIIYLVAANTLFLLLLVSVIGDGDTNDTPATTPAAVPLAEGMEMEEDKNLSYDGSDLIDWINNNGGYIHPNARIGLDPTGQYRGVFVKSVEEGGTESGIEDGETVARIPWDLIVKPRNYKPERYWSCEALHELHDQFLLGDESKHAPYIRYLKNQPRGRMVNEWSDAGKDLLKKVLNHDEFMDDMKGPMALPPRNAMKDYEDTWLKECEGEDTELAKAAFFQFTSRDEDTLMVPFYDMHNHSNDPKQLNTISDKPKKKGKPFFLRSIRDIRPGEQIIISYNRCNACWFDKTMEDCSSYSHYDTSNLFDIFGFVEGFPQSWRFQMRMEEDGKEVWDTLKFCLSKNGEDDDDDDLMVMFGDNYSEDPEDERPVKGNILWLGKQIDRLKEVGDTMKGDAKLMSTMPRYEWDAVWRYHEALMTAMSAAVLASDFSADVFHGKSGGDDDEDSEDDTDEEDSEDDSDDSEDDSEEDEYRDEL